ncbi:cupin domain-containing protein [Variovorax sp. Varisp41]|jgi:mannose-6-phosphate isomerase-like protein (cupin superfamily)|uniref:cupin domain-containing protein n=1 Tax=unclassified Variovorax TaxID=663243 RepID=UPI000C4F5DC5|nr:cupin domain-containing protein [Variovorax sp.]MBS77838.1 mannose-6-phosphate isomerase [Variovorax sp.]|eukprot:TRINITY_DN46331_c0_g1_i1.p1 TRINITY_DN46331_c0_g1~~TRINITY_DN46331_c0_g1_i1.p1  ORF type:complete len:119 (+),score=19.23 TRINITY_DN46331_c0_g1_i1:30-359(+)
MNPVNPGTALPASSMPWEPTAVARFNDNQIMVVKAQGAYEWHRHDDTDDFFLVLKGRLTIEMRDRSVTVAAGELFVVPRGVEHRPIAQEEAHFLLIEPSGTPGSATGGG